MNPYLEARLASTDRFPSHVELNGHRLEVEPELSLSLPAPSSAAPCRHERHVIKQGDVFVVCHADGVIHPGCSCGQGIYYADTRYLSGLSWTIQGQAPRALSCHTENNFFSQTDLINETLVSATGQTVRAESLHMSDTRVVDGAVHERLTLTNYHGATVALGLELELRADFCDMFEVRGMTQRQSSSQYFKPETTQNHLWLRYQGSDHSLRETHVHFLFPPTQIEARSWLETRETGAVIRFELELAPGQSRDIEWMVEPRLDGQGFVRRDDLELEIVQMEKLQDEALRTMTEIETSEPAFQEFLSRGAIDLLTLLSPKPTGQYPVAGTPWYACPFGRDGLLTAYQALMLDPGIARGTLRYLAQHQGSQYEPSRDEEPGKILHESRIGELSKNGEVPFAPSYCTVDATPLFLVLFGEYYRWTGDLAFVRELWPNAMRALEWIDRDGDLDGDGFVEYRKKGEKGLSNQGWKDSWDSILHPDGRLAEAPIALAEVQGYVYDAKRRMAELAGLLGQIELAAKLEAQATALREQFNAAFWSDELGTYALALDGQKQQVLARSSNPGHGLWSGIVDSSHADALARELLGTAMFSGWGIRTLSAADPNFNPVSYHNGTVWPHDNALIAKGLASYGFAREAEQVMQGLFAASQHFKYGRLPELFCGFGRLGRLSRPVPYPVACSPQAWAAGSPILLLQSLLGLEPDGANARLVIRDPHLPEWAGELTLRRLRIGSAQVDLSFWRENARTRWRVLETRGSLTILG